MKTGSRRTLLPLTLALFAILHAWMAVSVSDTFSTTADEIAHLSAGRAYWRDNDYRLQPENGLLPQRWAALPLLSDDLRELDRAHPAWAEANVWKVGDHFFHREGNNLAGVLRSGRIMIAILGGALVFAVGLWAARLGGPRAGLATGALAAFSPTLLAHAGLATSDTASALGFILAASAWWALLHRITIPRILFTGVACGFLALAKFSAALFAPIAVLLLVVRLTRPTPLAIKLPGIPPLAIHGITRRFTALVGIGFVSIALAWGVIWAGYGFRYEARGPDAPDGARFALPWDEVMISQPREAALLMADGKPHGSSSYLSPGPVQSFVKLGTHYKVLPEAWLYGLAFVDRNSRHRLAYFAGEWEATGWVAYFPVAYLLKSTWPELLLHALGLGTLIAAARRNRPGRVLLYKTTPLLVLLLVYGAFSLRSSLNIGHRHILPMYAAAAVIAGLSCNRRTPRWAIAGVSILLGWHAVESLRARPDYLAYFNPLAGEKGQASRYFVDSSLDWGQDLPRLRAWLTEHAKDQPVFLSYFGSGAPAYYGINAVRIGDTYFDQSDNRPVAPAWSGGWYVISHTMWRRVYTHVRGPWTNGYETRYQQLRAWLRELNHRGKEIPPADENGRTLSPADLNQRLIEFEHLRFGRLCRFLQERAPDALVGATFQAFLVSDSDVAEVLYGEVPVEGSPR